MFLGTTSVKGHSNSSSALKRHSLRVRNKMKSCSKSLCIIVAISVVILLAISSTVIHLGQDLIYAEREKESASQLHKQRYHHHQHGSFHKDDSSDSDSGSESSEDEDTEQMDINGRKVSMKKSELQRVWKEVEAELPKSDEQSIRGKDGSDDDHSSDSDESDDDLTDDSNGSEDNNDESDVQYDDNNDNNGETDTEYDNEDETESDDTNIDTDDNEDNTGSDDTNIDTDDNEDNAESDDTDIDTDDNYNDEDIDTENETESDEEDDKNRGDPSNDHEDHAHANEFHSGDIESGDALEPDEMKMIFDDKNMLDDDESEHKHESDEDTDSDSETEENGSSSAKKRLPSLDSDDLERLLYPEYFESLTFFDIDPEDVDALVKYWKEPGKSHYNDLRTKYRTIQDYDLKETIMKQDEHHNKKLNYMYDLQSDPGHSWNVDYDYLYPFMIPIEAYDTSLLNQDVFVPNVTQFIHTLNEHPSQYISAKWDIYDIFAVNNYRYKRIISKQEMYDKHEQYLRDNYRDVELIFPENDTLLFAMLHKFGERLKAHIAQEGSDSDESNHGGRFIRALKSVEEKESSDRRRARRRLEGFGLFESKDSVDLHNIDVNDIGDSTKNDVEHPRMHSFNGLTSDITYLHRNRSSVKYLHNMALDDPTEMFMSGNLNFNDAMENDKKQQVVYKNNRFWRLHDHCVRRKSATVYPNWRILYASKPLTCDMILEHLLDPLSQCLMDEGIKCPLLIDHGYFRFVFKSEAPAKYLYENPTNPEEIVPIVLKVMKTEFVDWTVDWMRHIREAIFLQQLQRWEKEFIEMFGAQFESLGQPRAFYYVPELGHCLYPTYITVTPYYETTLKRFTHKGGTKDMSLRDVTVKALQILSGLQVMHHVQGGPYMHTDIQPRQFMIDDNGNVLINDFNRGKFTEYYFKNEVERSEDNKGDVIIPCTYCMPFSHGHYRAPEEYYSDPLNEGLDIWSICYTIWNLFSYEKPWSSFGHNYDAIKYILHDYQMRSKLPYSIPPYLQDVLRHCWRQNMYERPDINELMRKFRYFYRHIDTLSDGRQRATLEQLYKIKAYRETNSPDINKIKEYV